jgi:hypothetical protein
VTLASAISICTFILHEEDTDTLYWEERDGRGFQIDEITIKDAKGNEIVASFYDDLWLRLSAAICSTLWER